MSRRKKCRCIDGEPCVDYFKPRGIPLVYLDEVELNLEEYEALRLKDYEKMDQKEAAIKMDVSQPTFHRIYNQAKEKIAKALVEGQAIKINGGNYQISKKDITDD
jgi:predicted DNA-binding protein (UPF0251 family)